MLTIADLPEDDQACRRLAAAVLLRACLDAGDGDAEALAWLEGDDAEVWADLLGLERWPPARGRLVSKKELQRRRWNEAHVGG